MSVEKRLSEGMWRIFDTDTGSLAVGKQGNPIDGGGVDVAAEPEARAKIDRQLFHINSAILGKEGQEDKAELAASGTTSQNEPVIQ